MTIGKACFIGSDITLDGIHPEYLIIGEHVHITAGTKILNHYYIPDKNQFSFGNVVISSHVFIGVNTLIINAVTIGEGAVLAAGSVVTKDIPAWEVWGGVPAKFIRKRENPYK